MSGPFATFPSKQPKKGFPGRCCATTGRAAERAEPSRAEERERERADDERAGGEARRGALGRAGATQTSRDDATSLLSGPPSPPRKPDLPAIENRQFDRRVLPLAFESPSPTSPRGWGGGAPCSNAPLQPLQPLQLLAPSPSLRHVLIHILGGGGSRAVGCCRDITAPFPSRSEVPRPPPALTFARPEGQEGDDGTPADGGESRAWRGSSRVGGTKREDGSKGGEGTLGGRV